jgi:dihydrofolate reductase
MGKVIYSTMLTLDGFIEGPERNLDWAIIDEELHRFVNREVQSYDAFLYGRRMYEVMADHWPTADTNPASLPVEVEFARIWQSKPKIVFSRATATVNGEAQVKRDVIPAEIAKLKERSPYGLGLGGANLASTFQQLGLIDEYQLYIHPVVLGAGTQAFQTVREKVKLNLLETHTFGSGVVFLRYTP